MDRVVPSVCKAGTRDTIIDVISRAVEAWGGDLFLEFSGTSYTYREIDAMSTRFANALAGLGVQCGDTVVSMLDNNIECVVTWIAVNKLRAVWVPVNTAYKGEFLRHTVTDAAAAIVICEEDYTERFVQIAEKLPQVKLILHRGPVENRERCPILLRPLEENLGTDDTPIATRPAPSDLAMLIYTGGTTGPSKGCMISHNYCCNQAYQTIRTSKRQKDELHYTCLPMYHFNTVSTAIVAAALVGAPVAIGPRFSVSRFWPEVERTGARIATILGSMPAMIANAPDNEAMKRCFGQLRQVRGAPYPPPIEKIFRERFGVEHVGSRVYGLTEATMVTSISVDEYSTPGSSGKRNEDFDVRIFDDEGRELPAGQAGEVVVRPNYPDIIFQGYWRRPEETLKIMKDMWLHTGDIGKFDEDGFFYFVDRKKDYLRRRGENISSVEVEATFLQHPAVKDVAAHAVLSEVGEDDLKITVVLEDGCSVPEVELFHWSVDQLPYFALPRYIEYRAELPRSPLGRILKYQLRDEGKTPSTWDREEAGVVFEKR